MSVVRSNAHQKRNQGPSRQGFPPLAWDGRWVSCPHGPERVVWGWSVNDKKARLRDVGVVNYKDTPRKVVGYRTPAQMVSFRIPRPKLRKSFYGLWVMVAAMCAKRSSEGGRAVSVC